jgi:hypothetical protein
MPLNASGCGAEMRPFVSDTGTAKPQCPVFRLSPSLALHPSEDQGQQEYLVRGEEQDRIRNEVGAVVSFAERECQH